jgi:predicted nucleotidyltransferase
MSTTSRAIHEERELASVLFGQTRLRVLGWLFGHPDEAYYLRQIVRQTGAAHGAVQRELAALTGAGVLRRTVRGRQVYFQANRESPVFPELQSLLMKTTGAVDVLREALAPLADRIAVALIFGSAARGELRHDSDIDLLVVGDAPFAAVAAALTEAQERLGRDVNPTVYPADEFRAKILGGHHFLTSVVREPHVFIIGGSDELGGLGAERLADSTPHDRKRDSRPPGGGGARSRRQRG